MEERSATGSDSDESESYDDVNMNNLDLRKHLTLNN
jgi:hypothetical protein